MSRFLVFLCIAILVGSSAAQNAKSKSAASATELTSAAKAAATGHCAEALAILRRVPAHIPENESRLKTASEIVRCGLAKDDRNTAIEALQIVNREFSRDPEALYLMIHAFSDLSERTSIDMAKFAPDSLQAHELNAEALETQGKWDEAVKEYKWIEDKEPQMPGIHFRLGRLLLSKPKPSPAEAEQAKTEMQQELKVDPNNAGAEYVLGELARQANEFPTAEKHFSKASKIDSSFAEAYLGWGTSLVAEKKFAEAIAPLETAVKLEPGNPTAHYSLGMAYSRAGRKQDADREFALHQQLSKQAADAMHGAENQGPAPQ